jgi:hypothetical protein
MFTEDIRNSIFPISLRRDEDTCKITFKYNKNDLNLIESILNNFNQYGSKHKIDELIKSAIEGIGRNIIWHGESIYEIYKESDEAIKIISLIPTNFIDLKFFYIQTAPKNTEKKLLPKFINNKLLWKISIPKELEKNYSFKTILSSIDEFDSHMPKSMRNDFYQGNNISSYNTKKYEEKRFLFVNELTRDWGWDQRKWTANDDITEYFNNYKRFKFQAALTIFRKHIITELNNLFSRLEVDVIIKVEGLLTFEEYEKNIERYLNGDMSHAEAYKILFRS